MSRWLPLYLRSRRVPLALAASAGAVAVVGGAWRAFASGPEVPTGLAIVTSVLVLAPLIPTLSGDDDALESTAALPWPPRRALHLIGLFAAVVALVAGAAPAGVDFGTGWQIVRNGAGLVGLVGLGAALTGAHLAWLTPLVWTAFQAVTPADIVGDRWQPAVFWLLQPGNDRTAATLAAILATAGLIAYAARVGPRRFTAL